MSGSEGFESSETPILFVNPPSRLSELTFSSIEKRKTSINFFGCVKPVYDTSKKFGLMIFSIKYTANGEMESSHVGFMDIFWFIATMLLNVTFGILSFIFLVPFTNADVQFTILFRTKTILMTASQFLCLYSTALSFVYRDRLVEMMRTINEFDKEVKELSEKNFNAFGHINNFR